MGQLGRLVELGQGDLPALQALFERCAAYFQLVQGSPPRHGQARRWLLEEAPAGAPIEARTVFGLRDDEDRLVGAVDCTRDHPTPGDWWLGTMIIEPSIRGVGLGAGFHVHLLGWLRERGARGVQLRVPRDNPGALRFWARAGYQETGTASTQQAGRRVELVTMRLGL
jgi:GNAT superfamily N-acetyltransferase